MSRSLRKRLPPVVAVSLILAGIGCWAPGPGLLQADADAGASGGGAGGGSGGIGGGGAGGSTAGTGGSGGAAGQGGEPGCSQGSGCSWNVTSVELQWGVGEISELRQGLGLVWVTLTGTDLEQVTTVSLKGASQSLPCTGLNATTETVKCMLDVPHGAALGSYAFSVAAQGQEPQTVEPKIAMTAIHVSRAGGNDDGAGSASDPFKHLFRALGDAGSGDEVVVAAGTYQEGEVWPSGSNADVSPNLPAGVTLRGVGAVVLKPTLERTGIGLVAEGPVTIENIRVEGFEKGIVLRPALAGDEVTLTDVAVQGCKGDGLVARARVEEANEHLNLFLAGGSYSNNGIPDGGSGIAIFDGVHLVGVDVEASFNQWNGIYARTHSTIHLTGGTFSHNTSDTGILAWLDRASTFVKLTGVTANNNGSVGLNVNSAATASITGGSFSNNTVGGISVTSQTDYRVGLTISGTYITGNTTSGLRLRDAFDAMIRWTTFDGNGVASVDCSNSAIFVRGNHSGSTLDLGTADDPGNNTFWRDGAFDVLCEDPTGGLEATVHGNSFEGLDPDWPLCPAGTYSNALTCPGHFEIHAGSSLSWYP